MDMFWGICLYFKLNDLSDVRIFILDEIESGPKPSIDPWRGG